MDISKYWQAVKKQSKELTGVSKISAGIFHGSGIGSSLESYIKAVTGGDSKKIKKAAADALKKTEKYLNTIHKKEVATGKKAMTKEQLKSATIVGDALEKIIDQLNDVVSGAADAGSFDRDGGKDVYDKVMGKAEAHIDMRNKVAKDAKGFLASYKKLAAPAAKMVALGKKSAKEAETTKKSGSMMENMNAIALAGRAVDEIQNIVDKIDKHYQKNISASGTEFMTCRGDFKMGDIPKQYLADYKKRHNAAWKPVAAMGDAINVLRHDLKADLETAKEYLDVAEGNSMQGKDPAKQIEKIEAIEKTAIKLKRTADTAAGRVESATRLLDGAMKPEVPVDTLQKTIGLREPEAKKRLGQYSDCLKSAKKLITRVDALAKGTEGQDVVTAATKAKSHLTDIEGMARKVSADFKTFTAKVVEAKKLVTTRSQAA